MKARDVLAKCDQTASTFAERDPLDPRHIGLLVAALLAQTPEGEGVYIAPDGTLMRVQPTTIYERGNGPLLYRLVPIEEATE